VINKLLFICVPLLALAPQLSFAERLDTQRKDFIEAYNILHKGGAYSGSHLKDYVLASYLDFERINQHLKRTSDQALDEFIRANPKSYLANKLMVERLTRLSKQQKWQNIITLADKIEGGGSKAKCPLLSAQINTLDGKSKQVALLAAKRYWLKGKAASKSCNTLIDLLHKNQLIDDNDLWQRLSKAMDKGKTRLAKSLAKNTKHQKLVTLWAKIRKKPSKYLNHKLLQKNNQKTRHLMTYAIKRIARKDTAKAKQKWGKLQQSHGFTKDEKSDVNSYIATRDAIDHKADALEQLMAIPSERRSKEANVWMARSAIRRGRWQEVLNAIKPMNHDEKKQDVWTYWRTYAKHRLGKKTVPEDYYELSKNASFYGFLAADQLKVPYERLQQEEPDWDYFIPEIKNSAGFQRAVELYAIGQDKLARKEWMWELKKLSHHDKLVAAAYALKINQPFLAIITISQTKDWNQVGLRFPMKYKNLVLSSAKNQNIDPAWVYGIMRRESAFDSQISSSANARGLMQILPRTAKEVARKLGIKGHKTSDLLIPEKNARLGSAYLSQMLKKFNGNFAKATASYNAGPHRIPKWTPEFPIVAPRWIESIPFDETRNYVRAVMSYTTIYDYKLNHIPNNIQGKNLRLSERLHPIGGNL
jgi:soluble lytic murein transglycosylase